MGCAILEPENSCNSEETSISLGNPSQSSQCDPFSHSRDRIDNSAKSVTEFTGTWWVAQTVWHEERKLALDLNRAGIQHFLPMIRKVRYDKGIKTYVPTPLFPSYLFFTGDEYAREFAKDTGHIARVLEIRLQDQFKEQIAIVEKAVEEDPNIEIFRGVVIGQTYRVTAGPYMGAKGVVIRLGKKHKLLLQLLGLPYSASFEVEVDKLELWNGD